MKKLIGMFGISLSVAMSLGVPTAVSADDTKPVRVLFVLGSPPFHDIRTLPPILEKVLDQEGGFQVTRLEPLRLTCSNWWTSSAPTMTCWFFTPPDMS